MASHRTRCQSCNRAKSTRQLQKGICRSCLAGNVNPIKPTNKPSRNIGDYPSQKREYITKREISKKQAERDRLAAEARMDFSGENVE